MILRQFAPLYNGAEWFLFALANEHRTYGLPIDYLISQLGGTIHMEVPSGRGRLDLIIEHGKTKATQGDVVVFDETGAVRDGQVEEIKDGPHRIRVNYISL